MCLTAVNQQMLVQPLIQKKAAKPLPSATRLHGLGRLVHVPSAAAAWNF